MHSYNIVKTQFRSPHCTFFNLKKNYCWLKYFNNEFSQQNISVTKKNDSFCVFSKTIIEIPKSKQRKIENCVQKNSFTDSKFINQ